MSTTTTALPIHQLDQLVFLNSELVHNIAEKYQTPCYVYSEAIMRDQAKSTLAFPAPYGLTVRYAMKANPLAAVLKVFSQLGIHIDASSGAEVERAMLAGVPAKHIMLTSQEIPQNLHELTNLGMIYNACSLHQLEMYGRMRQNGEVSIRLNPGTGSGHRRSVSVGGPVSSFGIWHEDAPKALAIANKYRLKITTIHSHIGCGADPKVWQAVAVKTLSLLEQFPDAIKLNLGGGFKVARFPGEEATNLAEVGSVVRSLITAFAQRTGRQLHLEIEPGTYLIANAGTLITEVIDLTSTGKGGHLFAKVNTGMNDFMRPALHGSQHPIVPLAKDRGQSEDYVVVGHNCESTDLLTPEPSDAEVPRPRTLTQLRIGDLLAIEGVGAYSSAMRLIGYNSFATPNEVLISTNGEIKLINRRVTFRDYIASEIA